MNHARPMTFEQTEELGQYDFSKDFDPSELDSDECKTALSALDEERDEIKGRIDVYAMRMSKAKKALAYRNGYRQRILDRLGKIKAQGKKQRIAEAENKNGEDALAFVEKARACLDREQYLQIWQAVNAERGDASPEGEER